MKTWIRRISGFVLAFSFIMILGKAGASDCGADWSEIFPSTFIYVGIAAVSFYVWEYTGGNDPGNYRRKINRRKQRKHRRIKP
jgi:hypothetical protein